MELADSVVICCLMEIKHVHFSSTYQQTVKLHPSTYVIVYFEVLVISGPLSSQVENQRESNYFWYLIFSGNVRGASAITRTIEDTRT